MFNYLDKESPRFSGSFAVVEPDTPESITVVSYNIKLGEEVERASAELTRHPSSSGADMLLLQEMDEFGTERIAKTLAFNYVYYPASLHTASERNFGNAVLSKYPIRSDEKIFLPHGNVTRGQRRIAVRAFVDVSGTCVQVVSVHTENLSLSMKKRKDQVAALLASITDFPHPVIVGGDFNTIEAPALEFTVQMFSDSGLTWASEEAGITASFGIIDVQSDHIFTRGFNLAQTGHIESANASDHKPVWVELVLAATTDSTAMPQGCQLSGHSAG